MSYTKWLKDTAHTVHTQTIAVDGSHSPYTLHITGIPCDQPCCSVPSNNHLSPPCLVHHQNHCRMRPTGSDYVFPQNCNFINLE